MHAPSCSTLKTVMVVSEAENDFIRKFSFSLRRFQSFIETSGWDRKIVRREKWVNRVCRLLIGVSLLYLCPILAWLMGY